MATGEALSLIAEKSPTPVNPASDKPMVAAGDRKKASNPKKGEEKKPSKSRSRSTHPTYLEMIGEAITSLKEKTGSSQFAITKFIEDKYKAHLPSNFSKLILIQLRKFTASGKLTKVKNSFKLPAKTKKPSVIAPTKEKPAVTTKAKPKSAVVTLPKVKAVLATKPKRRVTQAVKVSKPKPKTVVAKSNRRPAKVAKTSAKDDPGKNISVAKKTVAAIKKTVTLAKTTKNAKSGKTKVKVPVKKTLARKAK